MRVVSLGSGTTAGVLDSGINASEIVDGKTAQMLTVQSILSTGAASAITMDLEGSLDNINWFVIDTHAFSAGELSGNGAMWHVVDKPVKFLRANASTLTCGAAQAQIDTIDTIVAANTTLYRVTIDGVNFDYTSDGTATVAEIVAGLVLEINVTETNGSVPVTAADVASTSITLTADVAGTEFIASINGNMAISTTTANISGTCTIDAQVFLGR